MKVRKVFFIYL